jgi:cohesin complex subunit SA-1/2
MPARNSSMELSSPEIDVQQSATRRKSGRVVRKPDSVAAASTKRKRNATEGGDIEMEDASDDSEESDEEEPDEEELKEQRKKRARSQKKAPSKPATKKAKAANGEPVRLAIRPNPTKKSRAKPKLPNQIADAEAVGGLYGESSCALPLFDR